MAGLLVATVVEDEIDLDSLLEAMAEMAGVDIDRITILKARLSLTLKHNYPMWKVKAVQLQMSGMKRRIQGRATQRLKTKEVN
jgi:hypothetical protein